MTVAFVGGTGVSTTGSAMGTTSTTVAYNNVAAGRLAILTVGCKPNTGTITTPSGWTKIGEQQGGTGTTANDTGQTKTAQYYRVLDGTETGSVTVTGTSTGSIQGAMDVYSKSRPKWDASLFAVASDASHGTNHSATSGTFTDGTGVNAGDFLHVGHSGDTDDSTTATSAATITQSGSTIGTVTGRSQRRNTSGNQGMTYTWSASVSAGSHNDAAIVTGFTWSVSSCGPDLTSVLREYDNLANLVDTFDSTIDSAKWDSGGTVGVTSGAAVLDVSGYTYLASTGSYAFAEGDVVVLHTVDFPTTGGTYYAGMRVGPKGNGGGDFIGIYFHGDGTVSFERSGSTNVDATLVEADYAWVRIRRDASGVHLEHSATGSSWTEDRLIETFDYPAWINSTGLEVVIEGAEGDSWSVDDFNNAPTSHDTSGTASTAVTASATVATARTTTGTASASTTATATRSTARVTTGTASASTTATAATSKAVAIAATAPAGATASATSNRTAATSATASNAATASASVATVRTTIGTASAALSATATRAGVHVTAGTASAGASASASVAGVHTTTGTGALATTATASTATARPTTGTAPVALAAAATRDTERVTEGTAGTFVTATTEVEGQETHYSSGEAEVFVTASATVDTERTTTGTASASATATAARSTARVTTGTASASVTASAVSEAAEGHTTSGAAPVAMSATATHASARVVARVAALLATATATSGTTRATEGTATVHVTASTVLASHALSGHPRIVEADRAARVLVAGRQTRIVDTARPRRRAD